ncbi:MAG: hypothetical protein V9G11_08530 [Bifidobacterium adolescentis]
MFQNTPAQFEVFRKSDAAESAQIKNTLKALGDGPSAMLNFAPKKMES